MRCSSTISIFEFVGLGRKEGGKEEAEALLETPKKLRSSFHCPLTAIGLGPAETMVVKVSVFVLISLAC